MSGTATSPTILLHELVRDQAAVRPDAPALTAKDDTRSYAELWSSVTRVAGGLRRLGLRRGDRVAVHLDKRIETVAAIFGTTAADGVFVPVNPLLRPRQVQYVLEDCSVRVLVTTIDRWAALQELDPSGGCLEHVVLVDGDAPAGTSTPGVALTSWARLCDGDGDGPLHDDPRHDGPLHGGACAAIDVDIAAIFYTSGSTGSPKGVVLSHRNLVVGAHSVSAYLQNDADDVLLAVLPLSFDAGFSQLTTAFAVGAHVVLHNHLLAADVVRLCERHGVTGLTCVPPLWIQLAERSWPAAASTRLRYFANTGGRLPRATLDRLRAELPSARPFLMYGLTEAFRSTYLDPAEVDRRPDSIGKAIPNAEILVVRPDGTPCEPGERGELVHRGALVALGYWNDPERTRARFRPVPCPAQTWRAAQEIAVWSGDLVVADEEGFLTFVGRNDEMIKTSGYRVSPTEVEEAAYETGLVRDAVALGVADERLGQRIALLVTAPENVVLDEAQLLAELRTRLPLYMVPRTVVLRDDIPRSPNGKFDRALVRSEIA